jgi:hypothetical protein
MLYFQFTSNEIGSVDFVKKLDAEGKLCSKQNTFIYNKKIQKR